MMMAPQSEKFNLTEREKEILQCLIESRSLRSIAESLFISLETVRTHVKHIYKNST